MLKPRVEVQPVSGGFVAEFWDCLRLDPTPVRQLREIMQERMNEGGPANLIIDLNGVGFAGSAALSGFVAIQRDCRARQGRVILCNVEPAVLEAFRITNLVVLFQFVTDLAAARSSLDAPAEIDPNVPAPRLSPTGTPTAAGRSPLSRRNRKTGPG